MCCKAEPAPVVLKETGGLAQGGLGFVVRRLSAMCTTLNSGREPDISAAPPKRKSHNKLLFP
ncbi:hypothetical protein I79_025737 [Cricetulus griseus]|uniref:Uncharacterized protein n=1 Tax=Cricetulus griseus TaxID=10029 RepID=G3IP35_CRIGR|nr:hypothetical protein I79_025737 [Cricetulus griseus]